MFASFCLIEKEKEKHRKTNMLSFQTTLFSLIRYKKEEEQEQETTII